MNERNRSTLQDALRRLQTHKADEGAWERLSQALDQPTQAEEHRETLQKAVQGLPRYQAPAWLWTRIERRLDRSARWARTRPYLVAAAVAALLLVAGWLGQSGTQSSLSEGVAPVSEKQGPASPDLAPAEDLSQLSPSLACLADSNQWSNAQQRAWQALQQTRQAWQQAKAAPQRQALRERYEARLQQFQTTYCDH